LLFLTKKKSLIVTNDDIPTHHLLIFEVDLHATAEGFKFTGYGHVGNSLEKLENNGQA
jgi:hypothetical protein